MFKNKIIGVYVSLEGMCVYVYHDSRCMFSLIRETYVSGKQGHAFFFRKKKIRNEKKVFSLLLLLGSVSQGT